MNAWDQKPDDGFIIIGDRLAVELWKGLGAPIPVDRATRKALSLGGGSFGLGQSKNAFGCHVE